MIWTLAMDKNSLPKHWQIKTLGEVCEIITGKTPSKKNKEFYDSPDYPFYKPTDLNAGYNTQNSEDSVSKKGFEKSQKLPIKSVLVTCIGTIGKTGLIHKEGTCNQQINAILPSKNLISEFIYFYIISNKIQNFIKQNASATTLPILNKTKFAKIHILIPPLSEQKQIVGEIERRFEKLDKAIENFRQIFKNLKLYRQSVLKFAFDGKFTNPNLTNWQTKPLGEVAITSSGGTPSRKNKYFWENGEINWLKSGELNDDFINFTEEKITQEAINKSSAKILPKGTLLIAMYGATIGKLGILNLETSTNQAICAIQNKKEILFEVKFLFYFLLFNRKKMINEAFGGAQKNISQMYLKNLQIPLPPLSEQKQIVSEIEKRFAKADKIENLINKSLKNAEILKQSILKQAFSGNLKVKK